VKDVTHIILWIFIGALVVLIVTHASGFSTATTAVGGQVTNDASLLAGYAPAGSTTNQGGLSKAA
jgi:hypothetical protein